MLMMIKKLLGMQNDSGVLGSICSFAGSYAPMNFTDCDGKLLPVGNNDYTALFAILGSNYGGDGVKTFAVPDLRPVDKKGNRIDWTQVGIPRQIICISGIWPTRP